MALHWVIGFMFFVLLGKKAFLAYIRHHDMSNCVLGIGRIGRAAVRSSMPR